MGKVIISRHVTFDEEVFPFESPIPSHTYTFLDDETIPIPHIYTHSPPPSTTNTPTSSDPISPISPQPLDDDTIHTHGVGPVPMQHHAIPTQPIPSSIQPPPPLPPMHPMHTRSQSGITKPVTRLNLNATTTEHISLIPTSYLKALSDPHWQHAMKNEYSALQENDTWELVPRPTNHPVIRCMWLFRHKFKSDGSLERYKARLVVNGKSQTVGIDCMETFSPVVKPATIRTILSLGISQCWPIHQLDVKNAFLH